MSEKCYKFPPSVPQHWWDPGESTLYTDYEANLLNDRPPDVYLVFISIGFVALCVQAYFTFPRVGELAIASAQFRRRKGEITLANSFTAAMVLVSLPFISSLCFYMPLLCPLWYYQFKFYLNIYQCVAVYLFSRMIVTYNGDVGSLKCIHHELAVVRSVRTNHLTSPPLFAPLMCCDEDRPCYPYCSMCLPCVDLANRVVTKNDLETIELAILQFVVVIPVVNFFSFYAEVQDYDVYVRINEVVSSLSTVICVTALYALSSLISEMTHGNYAVEQSSLLPMTQPPQTVASSSASSSAADYSKEQQSTELDYGSTTKTDKSEATTPLMAQSRAGTNDQGRSSGGAGSSSASAIGKKRAAKKDLDSVDNDDDNDDDVVTVSPSAAERFNEMSRILLAAKLVGLIIHIIGMESLDGLRGRAYTDKVMTQAYLCFFSVLVTTVPSFSVADSYRVSDVTADAEQNYKVTNPDNYRFRRPSVASASQLLVK